MVKNPVKDRSAVLGKLAHQHRVGTVHAATAPILDELGDIDLLAAVGKDVFGIERTYVVSKEGVHILRLLLDHRDDSPGLGGRKRRAHARIAAAHDHDVRLDGLGCIVRGDGRGGTQPVEVVQVSRGKRPVLRVRCGSHCGIRRHLGILGGSFVGRRGANPHAHGNRGGAGDGRAPDERTARNRIVDGHGLSPFSCPSGEKTCRGRNAIAALLQDAVRYRPLSNRTLGTNHPNANDF